VFFDTLTSNSCIACSRADWCRRLEANLSKLERSKMPNTDSRRTRILKYVFFSLGAFWLMRPDKVAPQPVYWNCTERTITQNGALYALHHRSTETFQRNLQKRVGAALLRPLAILMTCIIEFKNRSTMLRKVPPASLGPIGYFADVFVYSWWHQKLVDENSAMRTFPIEDGKPVRTERLLRVA